MSQEGTTVLPVLDAPHEQVDESPEEDKILSCKDLARALDKQKQEHDASIEALVQARMATLVPNGIPNGNTRGMPSAANVSTPPLTQKPPLSTNC